MLLISKICSAVLLAVFRLFAGLLPLKVNRKLEKWSRRGEGQNGSRRRDRVEMFLSMFLCFGAGLLLSTCFVALIPEVFFKCSRLYGIKITFFKEKFVI
jgi:zinc transporter 1/2/3